MSLRVLAVLATLAFPSAALAETLPGVGPVKPLASGLFEVQLQTGGSLITHGGDAAPEEEDPLPAPPRRPVCAASHHDAVLYGRPTLSLDPPEVPRAQIEEAVWRLNGALDEAALESGGRHADLRLLCDPEGNARIESFINPLSPSFADVVDAARLAGATDPDADYLIFYADDSPEQCGIGSFAPDDRLSAENVNNEGGGYAVIYSDCWDGTTALHEVAHTQGAVQPSSPYATAEGHCRDEVDVMCYADGSEGSAGMLDRCAAQRFDCGYDDYFDVAPEPGEYLASHWNLGSPLNRFVELSDLLPGEDPAAPGCPLTPLWMSPPVCEFTDQEDAEQPPVRILGIARMRRRGVRIALRCPAARTEACRGRLEVRTPGGRIGGRGHFRLAAGHAGRRSVTLNRSGLRAWTAGRLRRLRVIAEAAGAAARSARIVTVRGIGLHRAGAGS